MQHKFSTPVQSVLGIFSLLTLVGACDASAVRSYESFLVDRVSPPPGSRQPVTLRSARIVFNQPINPASVTHATVQVDPATAYRLSVDAGAVTVRLAFEADLDANATYRITLPAEAGIVSAAGASLSEAYLLSFQTLQEVDPIVVDSFAPISGSVAGGDVVTVVGAGFDASVSISFVGHGDGVLVAGSVQGTTFDFVTPPGLHSGPVTVDLLRGDGAEAHFDFEYVEPLAPTVTAVQPSSGPEAGGQTVTVRGDDLVPGSWVYFDGTPALDVTWREGGGDGELEAITPPGLGPVSVTVASPARDASASGPSYTYLPAPSVSGIAPDHGPSQLVPTMPTLVITGTNFQSGAEVRLGGDLAGNAVVTSATSIRLTALHGASGPTDVVVTNPAPDAQSGRLAGGYFRDPPPRIARVDPAEGPMAGGTVVTLHGSGFGPLDAPAVRFGGSASPQVELVDAQTVRALTPAGNAAGPVDVRATNSDGQTHLAIDAFVGWPPPTIAAITPQAGAGGSSPVRSTTIQVTGTDFRVGALVLIGEAAIAGVTVNSGGTLITGTLNRAVPLGFNTVQVINPEGQVAFLPDAFFGLRKAYSNCAQFSGSHAWNCTGVAPMTSPRKMRWLQVEPDLPGVVAAEGTAGQPNALMTLDPDGGTSFTGSCREGIVNDTATRLPADVVGPSFGVAVGDVDFDGDDDLVFAGNERRLLLNTAGLFDYPGGVGPGLPDPVESGLISQDVELADLDGDDYPEIILANQGAGPRGNALFHNDGSGTFADETSLRLPGQGGGIWNDVEVGDLDDDGDLDLLFVGALGSVDVWLNDDGNPGYFTLDPAAVAAVDLSLSYSGAAIGDLNGDGATDFVLAANPGQNQLLLGDGVGGFTSANELLPTYSDASRDIEVADMNEDGNLDIVVANGDPAQTNRILFFFPAQGVFYDVTEAPYGGSDNAASWSWPGWQPQYVRRDGESWMTWDVEVSPYEGACRKDAIPDILYSNESFLQVGLTDDGCTAAGRPQALAAFLAFLFLLALAARRGRRLLAAIFGTGLLVAVAGSTLSGCGEANLSAACALDVVQLVPPDGALAAPGTAIRVLLSEPVDSSAGVTLAVSSADGSAIAGTTTAEAEALVFTPSNALPNDSTFSVQASEPPVGALGCVAPFVPAWSFRTPSVAAPTLSAIEPPSGSITGGHRVDLRGSGFVWDAVVRFGGKPATGVVAVDESVLSAVTPAGDQLGPVSVEIEVAGQSASLTDGYVYTADPVTLSQVTPNEGPSAGGTLVELHGTGLSRVSAVYFRERLATILDTPTQPKTDARIYVLSPPGDGRVALTIEADGAVTTWPSAYTFLAPPRMWRLTPDHAPASAPGRVTLQGVGFGQGAVAPTVLVGGVAVSVLDFWSSDTIVFDLPGGVPGMVNVGVENPDLQMAPETLAFLRVPPPEAPVLSPPGGHVDGNTLLTVTCAASTTDCGFMPGAKLRFGAPCDTASGADACTVPADFLDSATLIGFTPAAAAAGLAGVEVVNADGQASTPTPFSYYLPPAPTQVAPSWGPTAGTVPARVLGSGFQAGAEVVWDGTPLTTTVVSPTELAITVPAGPQGVVGSIEVVNPDYGVAGLENAFSYREVRVFDAPDSGELSAAPSNTVGAVTSRTELFVPGFGLVVVGGYDFLRLLGGSSGTVEYLAGTVSGTWTNVPICGAPTFVDPTSIAVNDATKQYAIGLPAGNPTIRIGKLADVPSPPGACAGFIHRWTETTTITGVASIVQDLGFTDVDADGLADLVAVNWGSKPTLLLYDPTGSDYTVAAGAADPFAGRTDFSNGLLLADFSGDGLDDILVLNFSSADALFLSNETTGVPTLAAATYFSPPDETSTDAVAEDLDGDGDLDLVVAIETGLRAYRNDSNGLVDVSAEWGYGAATGSQVERLVLSDWDGDERPDLFWATVSGSPDAKYGLLFGDETGAARAANALEFQLAALPTGSKVGSLVPTFLGNRAAMVVLTDGGLDRHLVGTRSSVSEVATQADWPAAASSDTLVVAWAQAEMTGDSRNDLLLVSRPRTGSYDLNLSVQAIAADGSMAPVEAPVSVGFAAGVISGAAVPWDVDGNGDTDVIALFTTSGTPGPNFASVLLNDGSGHLSLTGNSPHVISPGAADTPTDILAGDAEGTGQPVLVTLRRTYDEWDPPGGGFFTYDAATGMVVGLLPTLPVEPVGAAWVDIDGLDGRQELVVVHADNTLKAYSAAVVGTELSLTELDVLPGSLGPAQAVRAADSDGDGDIDLLLGDLAGLRILENVNGTFAQHPAGFTQRTSSSVVELQVGDVDGDGDLDVLASAPRYRPLPAFSGRWRIFLNEGNNRFIEETAQLSVPEAGWDYARVSLVPVEDAGRDLPFALKIDNIYSSDVPSIRRVEVVP